MKKGVVASVILIVIVLALMFTNGSVQLSSESESSLDLTGDRIVDENDIKALFLTAAKNEKKYKGDLPRIRNRIADQDKNRIVDMKDFIIYAKKTASLGLLVNENYERKYEEKYENVKFAPGAICVTHFIRGDIDGSGEVNILDAIYGLNYLFYQTTPPPCLIAADVDASDSDPGILDITFLLDSLFLGGSQIPAPYPNPGLHEVCGDGIDNNGELGVDENCGGIITPQVDNIEDIPIGTIALANQITDDWNGGITWYFESANPQDPPGTPVTVGRFATGELWALGPVRIIAIDPTFNGYENGFMINPSANTGSQSYTDGTVPPSVPGSFNAQFTPPPVLPIEINPTQSEIATSIIKSRRGAALCINGARNCLEDAAVLTVMNQIPDANNGADSFRPPYVQGDKSYHSVNEIQWGLLPSLTPPQGHNINAQKAIYHFYSRVHLDNVGNGNRVQSIHPLRYLQAYGAAYSNDVTDSWLSVLIDTSTQEDKEKGTIGLIQAGLDLYAMYEEGQRWNAGGGLSNARLLQITLAATILDNQEMKDAILAAADTEFHETRQHYYGVNGLALYGDKRGNTDDYWYAIVSNQGKREERDPYGIIDGTFDPGLGTYQGCCNSMSTKYQTLILRLIPEAKQNFDHEPFFEYADRFMGYDIGAYPDPTFIGGAITQPDYCEPSPYYGDTTVWGRWRDHDNDPATPDIFESHPAGPIYPPTYKVDWGPDPNNPGQCILDDDVLYWNSPTDWACQPGGTCGRLPSEHEDGVNAGGYKSNFGNAMWDLYRPIVGAICGNGGTPEVGEECDDGNTNPGDGCNQYCQLEECGPQFPGFDCSTLDDSLFCNGEPQCDTNTYTCEPVLPCADDGASCTQDCNEQTDSCDYAPNDNLCTGATQCMTATCNPQDANANANGCVLTPQPGLSCNDGYACTQNDVCGVSGECDGGVANNNLCSNPLGCAIAMCDAQSGDGCSYAQCPVSAGLIHYWPFDETSGTIAGDNIGNNDGTLINGPQWTIGSLGNAIDFDGSDDYVTLGNMDFTGSEITIAAWIYADTFQGSGSNQDARIISKANGVQENNHFWMISTLNSAGTKLRFRLKTNGITETLVSTGTSLQTAQWYHIAATYDGTNMKLYINGQDRGSTPKTGSITTSPTVEARIGSNPTVSDRNWDGKIDEVGIWNRALTQSEIQDLIQNGI